MFSNIHYPLSKAPLKINLSDLILLFQWQCDIVGHIDNYCLNSGIPGGGGGGLGVEDRGGDMGHVLPIEILKIKTQPNLKGLDIGKWARQCIYGLGGGGGGGHLPSCVGQLYAVDMVDAITTCWKVNFSNSSLKLSMQC